MGKPEAVPDLWAHLINHPAQANRMRLRSQLMREVTRAIKGWGISQAAAARKMGVTPTRLNQLLKGHIDLFSLDALILIAHKANLKVTLTLEPT